MAAADPIAARIAGLDWHGIGTALDEAGVAGLGPVLTPEECRAITTRLRKGEGSSRS